MKILALIGIGIANIVFGLKRRNKNLPLTENYKQNIERRYTIRNEMGLRDFEDFTVIFLGIFLVAVGIFMKIMDSFLISETIQIRILLVAIALLTYAYMTIRGTFLEKKKVNNKKK